ncbi:MAG: 23S rRNA (adenine(2503)-C(2))-methyltransferase RlmN [Flavobacteriales bacterium]|nr:23S rRNA (adenine(2503)-C(2))-methyltransferase RlmN [Flavobacteriales bacterium]MCB9166949.1 23S rRNA (adenine(2503)-C(2))-methyltransferase RlmN [Flavobacteriales bacterium]
MAADTDIRVLSRQEIEALTAELGEKPYRARQLWEWIWKKGARSWDDMSDLPKTFRSLLSERFLLRPLALAEEQRSSDGTVKCAFRTWDGHIVEGVLIPTPTRLTACISSQIGCSLTCSFCATGRLKRIRNLEAAEIVDQVVEVDRLARKYHDQGLTNIVYMGMGEPLLNYANTLRSAERISAEDWLGMSPRRITVSTAGIAKMILKLANDGARFELALSLHAANDAKRARIMPINEQNDLAALKDALRHFTRTTGRPVTFEYILLRGFNDTLQDAQELVRYASDVHAKVNLIEYNPIDAGGFGRTEPRDAEAFQQHLQRKGIVARIRRSRGRDIDAACGQLANKNEPALKEGERLLK